MNILVVDDIAINRRLLRVMLESEGITVFEAGDGIEALEVLNREKADAIISDILMPRMDGYRLCHEVRASARLFATPFIFYTAAYTSPGDEEYSMELGADGFLKKPVTASVMMNALRQADPSRHPHPVPSSTAKEMDLMKEYNRQLVEKLEQKNIELQLQTTALETAANAVIITDRNGCILWINPAFTALTGYTTQDVSGNTPRILKSGRHDRAFYQHLWKTLLSGQTWRGELINRRKDGSLYYGDETITPVRSANGTITNFIGIMSDVTARKLAEEEARMTHAQVRQLLDLTPAVIYRLKIERDEVIPHVVSENITALLGFAPSEALSQKWWHEQLHPEDRDRAVASISGTLSREFTHTEYRLRHKDGSYRWVDEARRLVRDADGKPAEFVGVLTDITERKRAEEVMRNASSKEEGKLRRKAAIELGVIFLLCVLVFTVGEYTEMFLPLFRYVAEDKGGASEYADEELGTLMFLSVAMIIFSYRRWRESRSEVMSQAAVMSALRNLHEETEKKVQQRTEALVRANEVLNAEIVERKRAQAAQREREEQFRLFIEHSPAAIAMLDRDMRYLFASRRWLSDYRLKDEDIIGKSHYEVFPDIPERWKQLHRRCLEGAIEKSEADAFHRADGTVDWVRWEVHPWRTDEGNIGGLIIFSEVVTARRRTEEELRFQTMLMEAQSEASLDGILTVDTKGNIISHNRRFAEIWGVSTELLTDRADGPVLSFATNLTVDPQQFRERIQYLYDHPDLVARDEVLLKDGRIFDRYTAPVKGADGTHYGRIWTFRDVTDSKKAQRVLEESERRFREMLENVDLIALTLDTNGRVTFCNDHLLRMIGWEREALMNTDWFAQFLPATDARTREMFFKNIVTGTVPSHYENSILTKSGDLREIVWNNTMLKDAAGNIIGTASIGEDVTDRKRAAGQIMKQAALLDQTQDAITVRNLEGRILFWNKGAEKMFGWTSAEAVGRTIFDLLQENLPDIEDAVDAMLSDGEWSGELHKVARDGHKLIVQARWTLVRDSKGDPDSILAINTDITEKKEIEAQFLRAQRMESIGTLAGGVAHDLNNILAPILMSIGMLRATVKDKQSLGVLETIEASSRRGSDIVRQILSFARGIEGRHIEIQIKHLLKDILRVIRETFPKNIRLETMVPNTIWTLMGDPTQLHQVLLNMAVNARDAMPDGGVLGMTAENSMLDEKDVSKHPHAKAGPHVVITVSDSGMGMTTEVLEKIYDPFFTTKEVGKGTGLGLSTASAIVKSHGGFIEVRSEPRMGTTFHLYLPAMTSPKGEEEQFFETGLPRGNGEMILIVDDETSILSITAETLEAFGYEVLTASNGASAVARYAEYKDKIVAVLTDMIMPVMDGAATVHALQQINPAVKIIAASGMVSDANKARIVESGVKYFLEKPYTAESLLETLQAILQET